MTVEFTVYGVAQAKGNMRAVNIRGMKHPIITDSNRSAKSWAQLVAEGASRALQQLPKEDRHLVVTAARCSLGFYLPRPKRLCTPKYRGAAVAHTCKPDIDKLTRSVLDALTGVLWADDGCVVDLLVAKRYADVNAPARVDVRVEPADAATLQQARGLFDTFAPLSLALDLENPQEG